MKKITNKITYGTTNEQQTNNKQITTNKNDKNIKNEKNNIISSMYDENVSKINDLMIECLNTTNINNINECIEYLDKLPIELIEYGLKKAARINSPSWNYAITILEDYVRKKFTTIEQVKTDDLNFKSSIKKENKKEETFEEQVERYKREWGLEDED